MPIPALPLFKHRDTVVTPADQNQFVTQFETTMDTMSNDVIPALNLAITDINEKVITATTARDESEDARDIAVAAKDEALTAVATLQEGAIDDTTIAPNKAFSNQHIENNYYDKTEVDTAISDATLDINTLSDKPTPIDTDNIALQETEGLFKKLSWSNLKASLLTYFDTFYSRTSAIFGINQNWVDVKSSRLSGVDYLNSMGKAKKVSVTFTDTTSSTTATITIDGKIVTKSFLGSVGGANRSFTVSEIVPPNGTYRYNIMGSANIESWYEYI